MPEKKYIIVAIILGAAAIVAYLLFTSTSAEAQSAPAFVKDPNTGLPVPVVGASKNPNVSVVPTHVGTSSENLSVLGGKFGMSNVIDASSVGLGVVQVIVQENDVVSAYIIQMNYDKVSGLASGGVLIKYATPQFQTVATKMKSLQMSGKAPLQTLGVTLGKK